MLCPDSVILPWNGNCTLAHRCGTPEVDLFASHSTAQLPLYITKNSKTVAGGPDAFLLDWNSVHLAALSDPLLYSYGIKLDPRAVTLFKRGLFHQRPRLRQGRNLWSLQRVMDLFQSDSFRHSPSALEFLKKTLSLTALASGFRTSQLRALTRFPQWTSFADDMSNVSLVAFPSFLAKNEREDHRLQPLLVPAWFSQGAHHPLCPVSALKSYLDASPDSPPQALFTLEEGKQLSSRRISSLLRDVIEEADPDKAPRAHDIRGAAFSLAFMRTFLPCLEC
ncbi:hypothetical protein E2C01_055075 [Portunus trituberculatus]|uniref:Tyr recombinase domain-containing protein n=1 Tax=Portunus trituberculatus TaxID=210409 RepID=A0A5B7GTQ9_PORTR|nr:hypothetical protein [Portunus trituberculatus]